ncbi:MAG: hypothetical protein ACXVXI_02865 [Mycobacteriaceae bacterium]
MPQLYEMRIQASGEVRDAAGNLISVNPVTGTAVVTEEQAREILASLENGAPE